MLLIQVIASSLAAVFQSLPRPGQDGRTVVQLALEVRIDDLADLELFAVLLDLLERLKRRRIIKLHGCDLLCRSFRCTI